MTGEYIKKSDALAASKITYIECLYEDDGGYLEAEADEIPVVFKRDIEALPAADVRPAERWTKTTDRLPEEYGEYLAVVKGEVMECCYATGNRGMIEGWSTCNADGFTFLSSSDVTHWMPMPELPENDDVMHGEICGATNLPCCRCQPGACESRK